MNRAIILLVIITLIGCKDHSVSDHLNLKDHFTELDTAKHSFINTEDFIVDTNKSIVEWRGTKLRRTGKHEGTVKFLSGKMLFSNGKLYGGQFVVDMKSIYITDIPLSDPVPRKNITNHLNIDFQTSLFQTSSFAINKIIENNNDSYTVKGEMTIMDISRPITIILKEIKQEKEYFSTFTFDRFQWKIGENGSWLEKKLVDADITLKVKIVLLDK